MQIEQAIVVCAFGWGKEFRLYKETLYVCNKAYRLARLTYVRLKTQQSLGVPSARLELRFGRESVTLRGIAAIEDARKAADYLESWCGDELYQVSGRSSSGEKLQFKAPRTRPTVRPHEQVTRPVDTPLLFAQNKEPRTDKGLQIDQKQERMTEHLSRADILPAISAISVPVRLDYGEQAYYSSRATRCGEPIHETLRSTYPAQDHGLLILTDRRLLFIGRKSQLVLEYRHLLHISRLEGALTLEADHWQKRAIFTMPQPELCASRLEAILQATTQFITDAHPRQNVDRQDAIQHSQDRANGREPDADQRSNGREPDGREPDARQPDARQPDAHKGHPYISHSPATQPPSVEIIRRGEEEGLLQM